MRIRLLPLLALLCVLVWPAAAQAQSELVVQCTDGEGVPIPNALRDAIVQDENRPEDRVYVLRRNDICYNYDTMENSGFHLRIIGEAEPADEYPATIQMVERDGTTHRMLRGLGDLTIKNVWISGQNTTGATTSYHPIQFEGENRRIVFDNVVFERNNFHIMGVTGARNKVYITNSKYRNFINTTQQWEGRGIRFEAGADTLVMENNTFLNVGHTIVQSEARPIEYTRFVHNTVVNVGRTLNSGGNLLKEAYYANNLIINPFWHGEWQGDFTETRSTQYAGFFGVGELPPAFGTDLERAVLYAHNAHWRDPQFQTWYNERDLIAQPLFNNAIREGFPEARTTQDFFDELDNFVARDNWWNDIDPGVVSYTQAPAVDEFPETSIPLRDLVPSMQQVMNGLRSTPPVTTPDWRDAWLWDPGRDPNAYDAGGFLWPLPENLSYTDETLRTGSTNNLPVGDLNWFPEARATWEANRDQYVAQIEAMAQGEEVNIVSAFEAEDAMIEGDAEVVRIEGFTYFQMDGSGHIQWTFELEEEKQYDLNLWTHMRNNSIRGQRLIVNGVSIRDPRNWGEYIWDTDEGPHAGMPIDEWTWTLITQDELHADYVGALTLPAGTNTVRIEPSWGWQNFAALHVLEAGTDNAVVELYAPDAETELVLPQCSEEVEFCSSGFHHVAMGPGASVSVNADLPVTGEYLLRLFTNEVSGSARILVDDVEVLSAVAIDESGMTLTDRFNAGEGMRKITVVTDAGGFDLDWLQVLVIGGTVSREHELPEGFALEQNYPNPFNPATWISFTVPEITEVTLSVYNMLGQRVATLISGQLMQGTHTVNFDGTGMSSGVYFYRVETPDFTATRKMVLIK